MGLSNFLANANPFTRMRQEKVLHNIHSAERFRVVLERERARADRNGHQFSIVAFDIGQPEMDRTSVEHFVSVLLKRIRFTDELGWFDSHRIAALLPETKPAGAKNLAEDVCQIFTVPTSPPKYTIHTYPSNKPQSDDKYSEQFHHTNNFPGRRIASQSGPKSSKQKASGCSHSTIDQVSSGSVHQSNELTKPLKEFFYRPLPSWKRAMDIVGAIAALIVLSPVMVTVTILIKLTSRGPILFKQQRAGFGGKAFTFYKFRSMVIDAEARKKDLLKYNERTGPAFKMSDDPRVTRLGKFIRKWSLDELPQLFNVLKGDLSLVGPRPLPIEEALQHNQWQDRRLSVTPGITCLWQVYARHDNSFDRWVRLDIRYILKQSPLLDLKILLMTLPAVLLHKGAS